MDLVGNFGVDGLWHTGDELKYRIQGLLRSDSDLQTILGKTASPYGVYFSRPPEVSPPFPLVTFHMDGEVISPSTTETMVRKASVVITAYSDGSPPAEEILERIERLMNQSVMFHDLDTIYVMNVNLDSLGPDDFDVNFNCYTLSHFYTVFYVRKKYATSFQEKWLPPTLK
jgi:hypothetical protein